MKKSTIPARTVERTVNAEVCSKAWGIKPNNAAVSKVPEAYEIKQGMRVFCLSSGTLRKEAVVIMTPTLPIRLNSMIHSRSVFLSPFYTSAISVMF
jgi:hypothetical protein